MVRDPLTPAGWRPKPGARVAVQEAKDEPAPPHGLWRVVDRSPEGWWLLPADGSARAWAQRFPHAVTQGCIERPSRQLIPPERL